MASLPVQDPQRIKLADDLQQLLKKWLPCVDTASQSAAVLSSHQSQAAFHRSARVMDGAVDRISRHHRSGYKKIPTPTQQASALRADQLASDGSPDAIVAEIEGIRNAHCADQAKHFVETSLTDLVNLGAVGVVEELDNGGLKIRHCDGGFTSTVDAIPSGQARTAHSVSFTRKLKKVLGKELSGLMDISLAICLQASDESGMAIPAPQQFLIARLGPYVIATSPRLVRKPSLFSRSLLTQPMRTGGFGGAGRPSMAGTAKFLMLSLTLGLLGFGFVDNSSMGSSSLIAGGLLSVTGCLFVLNNNQN